MKKLVYIHTKGLGWNFAGEMDYLLNTVKEVSKDSYDTYLVEGWYIMEDEFTELKPNNVLAKVLYPDWEEWSENPEYLVPRKKEE